MGIDKAGFFAVRDLTKSFGALLAVDGVSFDVGRSEILGVAGPNGSGKSTLFNIVTNIPFRADSGKVILEGREIQRASSETICRCGVARTFQRENVFASMSAFDNILVAVEQAGSGATFRERIELAERALDLVGFPATLHNMPAGGLPVFFRKLVMIAGAMALDPTILLLDEPASSLTQSEIDKIRKLILYLRETGVTVILIEHVLPLLTSVSDRLLVLDQGRIISEGTPASVIREPSVIEAYLGVRP